MVILQACATRTPKVHQLQVGVVYIQEDAICGQSGDLTSRNESFCLQVKIQCTQANSKIPALHHLITNLAPQKESVPENQIRYMCQCKHNACECLQDSIPGS